MFSNLSFFILLIILINSDLSFSNMTIANKYFSQGNYSRSASDFYMLLSNDFKLRKKDRIVSEWKLGLSLKELRLYHSSSYIFSKIANNGLNQNNPFYRQSWNEIGTINSFENLGELHINKLIKRNNILDSVPISARGLFYYHQGKNSFDRENYKEALELFGKVALRSKYYVKSIYYQAVIYHLLNKPKIAIGLFKKVISRANTEDNLQWLIENAQLNIARVNYKIQNYGEAIANYAKIPRDSENWLKAIFEASWSFLLLKKPNNSLGNIHTLHSPFFKNRFYPESYILEAINYLRLCRFGSVKNAMKKFKERYTPVLIDLKKILRKYKDNKIILLKLIYEYKLNKKSEYAYALEILDALSRTDYFWNMYEIISSIELEIDQVKGYPNSWEKIGLKKFLTTILKDKQNDILKKSSVVLYEYAADYYRFLIKLSDQTKFITAEVLLGKIENIRNKLDIKSKKGVKEYIGGMQPLILNQDLEYWPFEGEYWEDELGGYVYNLKNKCKG